MAEKVLEHSERIANLGVEVQLSTGPVTVKELSIKQIMKLARRIAKVFQKFTDMETDDGIDQLGLALADDEVADLLFTLGQEMSGVEKSELEKLGPTDALKFIKAVKEVLNWRELSKLFMELTQGLAVTTTSTE